MSEGKITRQTFSNSQIGLQTSSKSEPKNVRGVSDIISESEKSFATSMLGMKNDPVLISEVCKLPSKGLLYGNALGDSIELRAMTTIEERMRLSGENFWSTMSNIMNRCLVNSDFDCKNLADFDFFAALVKLRIITYGNIYKTRATCLSCGKSQDIDANLDLLTTKELPDDFVEPVEIGPLPKSGDVLGIRFLRVFDHIDILNQINEYNKSNKKNDTGNPAYTLEMEKMLVTVNRVELDSFAKKTYIEKMVGMDSSYFHHKAEDLFYGINRIGINKCEDEDCGGMVPYQIAPDEQFFRTSFDD